MASGFIWVFGVVCGALIREWIAQPTSVTIQVEARKEEKSKHPLLDELVEALHCLGHNRTQAAEIATQVVAKGPKDIAEAIRFAYQKR